MFGEDDKRLTLFGTPLSWGRDKLSTLFQFWYVYVPTIIIWVLAILALLADIKGFFLPKVSTEVIVLSVLLFLVGAYNAVQSTVLERFRIRLQREINSFTVLHEIAEQIRDYREKSIQRIVDTKTGLEEVKKIIPPRAEIVTKLDQICDTLNKGYIRPRHRYDVNVTLKIRNGHSIEALRGNYGKGRDSKPEKLKHCHVYRVLSDQKLPFLHVGNITKPTNRELKILGTHITDLKHRAERHGYKSLLALPIRTGNSNPAGTPVVRESLGFLGFDLKAADGFGNLTTQEIDLLACVVDSISEIVADYKISK